MHSTFSGSGSASHRSNHDNALTDDEVLALNEIRSAKHALLEDIQIVRRELDDVNREIEELELQEESKQGRIERTHLIGKKKFNADPKKGMQYLFEHDIVRRDDSDSVARYLFTDGLSKTAIGEYLGELADFNQQVLDRFVSMQDFHGVSLVDGLRKFLASFRLPGESQKIDRAMETFAKHYYSENVDERFALPSVDCCHILAFSLIMLNTTLHNPAVRFKPTLEKFIHMNRDISGGEHLSEELLTLFYDSVKSEAFKLPEETGDTSYVFVDPVREGHLFKQGRNRTWARRWFVLVDNCLFYFESDAERDREPRGIIPLDDVRVRLVEDASKHFSFELYPAGDSGVVKACKSGADGKLLTGKHSAYRLCADNYEERNAWVQCIEACIGAGATGGGKSSSSQAHGVFASKHDRRRKVSLNFHS